MTHLLSFCILKMCALKEDFWKLQWFTALQMRKCSRLTWQTASKVFRSWSTVTHCFIWKCNIAGWELQHQPSDRRIDLGQLKTPGVSGYDITEIFQTSYWKKKNEIERYYHGNFFFFFLNQGGNTCAVPSQRPAGAAKGTSICLPHVGMLRILTGFNKLRKAILLLLQSALQTHLHLCKPRCRQAHMQHPTARRREMLTAPDLHPVRNKNLYCIKQNIFFFFWNDNACN